ncbi:MAG: hypothetical protein ACI3ZK_08550 [Candidatus Cryptobacteroides sp.]
MKYFYLLLSLFASTIAFAQKQDPEKEIYDFVGKELEKYSQSLQLEVWQEFYIDSILTHDYLALRKELETLSRAKVESSDNYVIVQDKWMEQIYSSFQKVLSPEQWQKYLKQGAGREKKARDKRKEKRNK